MSRGRALMRLRFDLVPALPAALWLGLGILTCAIPCHFGAPWPWTILPVVAALAALRLCSPGRLRGFAWLFPLGAVLAGLHLSVPWQTYLKHLPREECGAEIEAVVVTPDTAEESLAESRPLPRATLRLRALRLAPDLPWTRCAGKVLVRLPAGESVAYGASIRAQGIFRLPDVAPHARAFDYRRYLRARGVFRLFDARAVEILAPVEGWRRLPAVLYAFGDLCAQRLVTHIESADTRCVLLAMTLGYRQRLDPITNRQFLRSGTIHLFAISGLHVGIIAGTLLLFLQSCRVSPRLRYVLLPPILGLYVTLAGAENSALRAWIMISVWAIAQGALRPGVPLNTLAVAALVLLGVNPLDLLQPGFQFSFTIVLVLILGWPLWSRGVAVVFERERWIPLRCRRRRGVSAAERLGVRTLGSGALAWFSSAGLVARANGLIIPAAMVVNLATCFLAWAAIFLAVPKILVSLLPFAGPDLVLGAALEATLRGILLLAKWGSASAACMAVPKPALGLVFGYYACLLLALAPRTPPRWRLGACGATVLALAVMALPVRRGPALVVFHGGDAVSPALLLPTRDGVGPVAIDTGGTETGRCLASWLVGHGADTVETLVLSGGSPGASGGARALFDSVAVRTLALPPRPLWVGVLGRAWRRQEAEKRRTRVLESTGTGARRELRLQSPTLTCVFAMDGDTRMTRVVRRTRVGSEEVVLRQAVTGWTTVEYRGPTNDRYSLRFLPSLRSRIMALPAVEFAGRQTIF